MLADSTKPLFTAQVLQEALSFTVGDYVVHQEHGIGKFLSLQTVWVSKTPHDCLCILYEGEDKLFVPVENLYQVSRYGSAHSKVTLDKLGTSYWQSRKQKAQKRIQDTAEHLINLAATRALQKGTVFHTTSGFEDFCNTFPHRETPDQHQAIQETLKDLASGCPMDRLICGDVGFGKTEVALRAAFVVAAQGFQVAVIVPTTLLAQQHFHSFQQRFTSTHFKIAHLSRLVPSGQIKALKQDLACGQVDIVISTSQLFSLSTTFSRLGLIIVDEEQHFGVKQKEKLKTLYPHIHVLTLTATPIPRTLQMALTGMRQISLINTPPLARKVPQTVIMPFEKSCVREAILKEQARQGKTFYVCPRIEDLPKIKSQLTSLVPQAKVAVAHGDLPPTALEQAMEYFVNGSADILLSTHIIESGIDIPSANTLIVHRADLFGLAQLYQLRGRIGRSDRQGVAYFMIPPEEQLTAAGIKRLDVLKALDKLGTGFSIAAHDMDIRGAGNLVGSEQSGHIRDIGIELYHTLLEEAIQKLQKKDIPQAGWIPQLHLDLPVFIPESYTQDLNMRLSLYQKLNRLHQKKDGSLESFVQEMQVNLGPLPPGIQNLLLFFSLKDLCLQAFVIKIEQGPKGVLMTFFQDQFPHPERLIAWIIQAPEALHLRPDHKLVWVCRWNSNAPNRLKILLEHIARLAR